MSLDGADASETICRRVRIYGRVQGVFFRDSLRRLARSLGVGGWVRNRPDGSVEAMLEGRPDRVERAIEFCRVGPPAARVDRVIVEDAPVARFQSFEIVR